MDYRTSYEVTPAMQNASVRQYFFSVLLGKRAIGLAILPLLVGVMVAVDMPSWVVAAFGSAIALLLILWVKTYLHVMAQARTGLHLMEHPRIEVIVDENAVEYRSSNGNRIQRWEKIERLVETKDFVVLMHGKVPLLSLPKQVLSQEALAFVKRKLPSRG